MAGTRDYPLAGVLGAGNLIHHARPAGLLGKRIETRCGLEGDKTDRDGGIWCPDCLALERAKAGTHDERGGDGAAVCSTPCNPDCDAVCHGDHVEGHKKQHWPYGCPAADKYFDEYFRGADGFVAEVIKRLRGERDDSRQQLAAVTARAKKAEALVAELGDEWGVQSEDSGRAQPCDDEDHARHLADRYSRFRLPGGERTQYRVVRRLATEWCDTETADASPEALSEPVERSETSGGIGTASNSSTGTAGLSEAHAFVVCATCNGSGGYCQRCREGQAGLPHSAHIVTCPDCLGGGTYPPATEDGQHG